MEISGKGIHVGDILAIFNGIDAGGAKAMRRYTLTEKRSLRTSVLEPKTTTAMPGAGWNTSRLPFMPSHQERETTSLE